MGQCIRKHRSVAVVVEQDQEERAMAVVLLEETELDVIECGTAEDALKTMDNAMAADRIALAFVNIRLPGRMDGVEFAQVVKRLCAGRQASLRRSSSVRDRMFK